MGDQERDTNPRDGLTKRFELARPRLHGLAYRMLGSSAEAEDAVQETWLRLSQIDGATVKNLGGWLTTVVSRVCLDLLRSRAARREVSIDSEIAEQRVARDRRSDPEVDAALADSVGVALLVVLDRLSPAERLVFVLHDLFAMPFDEIGPIVGRSATAARQIASRARRRVNGSPPPPNAYPGHQREVVEAFLRAARAGDLEGLLAVLDPDAVIRIDAAARVDGVVRVDAPAGEAGRAREIRGASIWAPQMIALSRGLESQFAQPALIDGSIGLVFAPSGKLVRAIVFTIVNDRITRIEGVGDPDRLEKLEIAVLESTSSD